MNRILYKLIVYSIIGVYLLMVYSCQNASYDLDASLVLAGNNRVELEKVLKHYHGDAKKYKAACFLISNMRWHYATVQVLSVDTAIIAYHQKYDSLYYSIVNDYADEQLEDSIIRYPLQELSYKAFKQNKGMTIKDPRLSFRFVWDVEYLSAEFMIQHIDNAFKVWQKEPLCQHLSFNEFCECILPYRSIQTISFFENGCFFRKIMSKHLEKTNHKKLSGYLKRYHHYISSMQSFFSFPPLNSHVGFYDLFVGQNVDCINTANNACNILRACGIPLMVNFNTAYKELKGRHYFCSFLDDNKEWRHFNPQTNCLDTIEPLQGESLNIIRNTYAAQTDSPYFIKSPNELVPTDFDSPCIKDVTSSYYETVKIELPFKEKSENNLAYLYAFNNNPDGLLPVCWGKINHKENKVEYVNAMYNTLYFPVFFRGKKVVYFSSPFYLQKDSVHAGSYKIISFPPIDATQNTGDIIVTRKYPRKLKMVDIAQKMVGGKFWGANRNDFSDSVLLLTISREPQPYLQDFEIPEPRSFRYFKYASPATSRRSNISWLEFLIDSSVYYPYTELASPLPVMKDADTSCFHKGQRQVVEKNIYDFRSQRMYDQNMQTASSRPDIYLNLEFPVRIKTIRMAPLNAENSIIPGNRYKLLYWDNGWIEIDTMRANYNYLKFRNMPLNKIYWLKNLDQGVEELPFIYKDGKQLFIYHDIIANNKY